jgi:hypothetical protein
MQIHDTFETMLDPRWRTTQQGQGQIVRRPSALHLTLLPTEDAPEYQNAQITEYDPGKKDFQFSPPLRLTVRAYSSLHPKNMIGTAGFGFWNHPFEPGQRTYGRPQTLWFFFSAAPSDMALARGVPGNGWKAATFNAKRWQFMLLAPFAPLGILLMRSKAAYNALWGMAQNALGISEAALDINLLNSEETYVLEWRKDGATFYVDGKKVHETASVPQNALGFICWMDNQYQIVTPQGKFEGGITPVQRSQSLVITEINIESL